MTKRNYENIWNLLTAYNFEVDDEDKKEIECIICRKILVNANQGPCGCRYCRKCIEEYLNDGPKKCLGKKLECEEDVLEITRDIQTDHRANRLVASLKVNCVKEGCNFRAVLSEIEEHIRLCNDTKMDCIYCSIGCDSSEVTESSMERHLNEESINHTRLVVDWMGNIKNEMCGSSKKVETLEEVVEKLREEVKEQARVVQDQASVIDSLQRELEVVRRRTVNCGHTSYSPSQLCLLEERISMLTKLFNTENEFIWKVDKMSVKVNEARTGVRAVVYSDPFYSHKYGYKLQLKMHPNGYGFKEGTHLYVLFCVMKGDYDDLLPWPLKRNVTLSILNRNDGSDFCSYKFNFDNTEPSFRGSFTKPTANMNMAIGNDEFLKLESIFKSQNILREDSILIKCVVSS